MSESDDPYHEQSRLLRQIADALGVPVAQLLHADELPLPGELLELIRNYTAIADVQGRQRVLNVARREADRSRSSGGRS